MDNQDGVEGFMIEKAGVWRSSKNYLSGAPYRHSLNAQATKDQALLQSRSETSLYGGPLDQTSANLVAELQSSLLPGAQDCLLQLSK